SRSRLQRRLSRRLQQRSRARRLAAHAGVVQEIRRGVNDRRPPTVAHQGFKQGATATRSAMADTPQAKQIAALDTPDEHVTFIRSQWAGLAAFAWEKYQREGRGAIVIDLRNATMVKGNINVPT